MDYRKRRQVIIVAVLVFLFILLLVGAYFKWIRQAPTCFDGRQNQKEEGLDCGGPCALSCERLTIKALNVEWTNAIEIKDDRYDLVAKIINPNPNYGLSSVKYNFKVFDETNSLITQQSGRTFIMPGQSKYLIESNLTLLAAPAKVELVIESASKEEWQKLSSNYREPEIYIHDKQVQLLDNDKGAAQASGIIKNNSDFDFDKILVSVILFDEDKKIIGVNKTEARTVLAGEDRYFSVLWFSSLRGQVKSVEMQVDTNLFSNDNFMRRFGTAEKFQEYSPTTSK